MVKGPTTPTEMDKTFWPNITWAHCYLIVDSLVKSGIQQFYVAPGMRNAPLAAAIIHHPRAKYYSGFDERSLSYRALGFALASFRPVAIVCTSGTALAHFYPAVIEAFKAGRPLVILTADRPPELVFGNANQTIDQTDFFKNFTKATLNLWPEDDRLSPHIVSRAIIHTCQKVWGSASETMGPVHINIPLRGTLEYKLETYSSSYQKEFLQAIALHQSLTVYPMSGIGPIDDHILLQLFQAKRPLIVIGQQFSIFDWPGIFSFCQKWNIPILLDVACGIKHWDQESVNQNKGTHLIVPSFDHPEVPAFFAFHSPDLVLHFDGKVVSKNYYSAVKQWKESSFCKVISIGHHPQYQDPSFWVDSHVPFGSSHFLKSLIELAMPDKTPYWSNVHFAWEQILNHKRQLISTSPLSYPLISKVIMDFIPDNSGLLIGNSTVVRSFDCYVPDRQKSSKHIKTLTTRGVSGIEGHLSSAIGAAEAYATIDCEPEALQHLTAVLGDIAMLHDLNALSELNKVKFPLVIVIANNQCGGIFGLLPIGQQTESQDVFHLISTPHSYNFKDACSNFNLPYLYSENAESFTQCYQQAVKISCSSQGPIVLEARFSEEVNRLVYKQLKTRES